MLGTSEGTHVSLVVPVSFTVPALFRSLGAQWFSTIRAGRGFRWWTRPTLMDDPSLTLCEFPVGRNSELSHRHHRAIAKSSEISDPRFNFRWQNGQIANLRVALRASLESHISAVQFSDSLTPAWLKLSEIDTQVYTAASEGPKQPKARKTRALKVGARRSASYCHCPHPSDISPVARILSKQLLESNQKLLNVLLGDYLAPSLDSLLHRHFSSDCLNLQPVAAT